VLDDYVSSSQHEIQLVGWTSDPVEDLLVSEMTSEVKSAIQSLPNMMREVVELHYIDELSYKEISHHLNIPIATIEGRLYRARRKLKEDLKMTQSTTDMFELREKLGELEEQVEALQDRQQRMAKEENMSIGQERSAASIR
jgi:RNA polymerase sigma-70 factor (ECF subfamily)